MNSRKIPLILKATTTTTKKHNISQKECFMFIFVVSREK